MSEPSQTFNLDKYRELLKQMKDRELKQEGLRLLQFDRFEILDTARLQVAEVRRELRRRHPAVTQKTPGALR